MRPDLHPAYGATKVACACGNSWETRSTTQGGELHLDICSNCHPFFTGKQKLMDREGRIDRFNKKYAGTLAKAAAEAAEKAAAKAAAPPAPPKADKPPKEKKAKPPKAEAAKDEPAKEESKA